MNDTELMARKSIDLTRRIRFLAAMSDGLHKGKDPSWHYEDLSRKLRDAAFDALGLAAQSRGPLTDLPGFDPKSESA